MPAAGASGIPDRIQNGAAATAVARVTAMATSTPSWVGTRPAAIRNELPPFGRARCCRGRRLDRPAARRAVFDRAAPEFESLQQQQHTAACSGRPVAAAVAAAATAAATSRWRGSRGLQPMQLLHPSSPPAFARALGLSTISSSGAGGEPGPPPAKAHARGVASSSGSGIGEPGHPPHDPPAKAKRPRADLEGVVLPLLQTFHAREGHSDVPAAYTVTAADAAAAGLPGEVWVGYGLGAAARTIWTRGAFVSATAKGAEKKAALCGGGLGIWAGVHRLRHGRRAPLRMGAFGAAVARVRARW